MLKRSVPVYTGEAASPLVHHPVGYCLSIRRGQALVSHYDRAGIVRTGKYAAASERCSKRALGIDYIPLSAHPRSGESAGKVEGNVPGDNQVWTDEAKISDGLTVSPASACAYRHSGISSGQG